MSLINEFFGNVYCINLDRRPDRWQEVSSVLAENGISAERHQAVDGASIEKTCALLPTEVACTMSHIEVIAKFLDSGADRCLVIEDDIVFTMQTEAHENVLRAGIFFLQDTLWDVFYLGVNNVTPPKIVSQNVGIVTRGYSTCAYGLNRDGAEYLIERLDPRNKQVDVQFHYLNRGRHYCTVPNIITQRPGHSDVQGVFTDYTTAFVDRQFE